MKIHDIDKAGKINYNEFKAIFSGDFEKTKL